ncbi:MAG TPA: hypothetical protein VH105_00605 [Burkholderiales bacterium]|nr:hypothetical protein [Burkholderiales bacterium]
MNNNNSILCLFTLLFILRARFLGHMLFAAGALLLAVATMIGPAPG